MARIQPAPADDPARRREQELFRSRLDDMIDAAAGDNLRWLMRWLIYFCARFRGGRLRISLLLGLIEPLLGLSAAQSHHLFRPAN